MARPVSKKIDWEKGKALYRTGTLSNLEISRQIGCSDVAVAKRAKAEGWARDLSEKVKSALREKLVRMDAALVRPSERTDPARTKISDEQMVDMAVEVRSAVVDHHRRDIRAGRELSALLMGQLLQATEHVDEIEDAIYEETKDDHNSQRRALMLRAVSLGGRAGVLKDLTTAMKNLQGLERVAFGLKDEDGGEDEESASKNLTLAIGFVKPNG